jgi:hypothetical protein
VLKNPKTGPFIRCLKTSSWLLVSSMVHYKIITIISKRPDAVPEAKDIPKEF